MVNANFEASKIQFFVGLLFLIAVLSSIQVNAQTSNLRTLSGVVVSDKNELVAGASVIVRAASGEQRAVSDADGSFHLTVPNEPLSVRVEGKNLEPFDKPIGANEGTENLQLKVKYTIPPVHESVVIQAEALDPTIDQRNDTVYKNSLFGRDDQLIQTLNAGINVGQHEGGGKSLEIRRFGYNLDHGGINGGLKILVDDVQQNQGTQGHGQGYLGQLKSLSPELIDDVDILNGPFSAQYGDFSGLGVVQIHLKESLPEQLTLRFQGGSFNSRRAFLAYSPELTRAKSFIAYDGSYTDGPFINDGRYRRDNVTSNYTRALSETQTLGFKLNVGRNNFFSSGQIPLDEVAAGRLDRFGFIDPFDGGRVRTGIFSAYYKQDLKSNGVLKVDGYLGRSLFDLFSNFTFFLNDPLFGDEIQQHDSRLQEAINAQYLRPYKLAGQHALFTAGANFHANQINVGLFPAIARNPNRLELNRALGIDNPAVLRTSARADVTNTSAYAQQAVDLFNEHLHLESGLRYDYFRFRVTDGVTVANARLSYSGFHGFYGTLGYRHVGNYRLDGLDAGIRASGLDVLDFSMRQRIRSWVDFNFSIDNLTDKHYFETQNYLESRVTPTSPVIAQIHATPGYSTGVTVGLTFHLFRK